MTRKEIVTLCNQHRQSVNAPPLTYHSRLHRAAQCHANYMAKTQHMSHDENIAGVKTVGERAHKANYSWNIIGENVAAGQTSASSVMNDWMHSEGHRKNILNGRFRNIGLGFAKDANGVIYWCMVLGSWPGA
ncbi:unnamed protein product [Adineta ricciae]|uniref:SCP domain-containing protein n=1 Tax=Adineta ricciae TaxID=249248 RepID=A0A814QZ35_ADIRI|nr:unnamed protein product [Adineta ricciae]CAF1505993.1 unnamed protein product [Adineta ricciae]